MNQQANEDPLFSARQKLERASEHLKKLWEESEAFVRGDNASMRSDDNLDGRDREIWCRYFVEKFTGPPAHWSLLAGDAVQNLCAALDHAAWVLVVRAKGEQWAWENRRRVYFPIRATGEKFDDHFVVKSRPPDLVAVLEQLQPFERNQRQPAREALWPSSNIA